MSSSSSSTSTSQSPSISLERHYKHERQLKYGINPQQSPAYILSIAADNTSASNSNNNNNDSNGLPFQVLNGTPGYINILDAINAWQLVCELKEATGLSSAASFKHVSPAGVGVAVPLSDTLKDIYDMGELKSSLTAPALAYLRARQADPMCSFGDFAAISDTVDEQTALFLKREVSDGIIAPGYDAKALEILKNKKNGSYIILQANPKYQPPAIEYREIYGVVFAQGRNNIQLTAKHFAPEKIVTRNKSLSDDAIRDLLIASICIKYTQSNSVAYALNGQAIGIGAGQQSRVDCVKLAGNKVEKWYLRQHPKVRSLPFKSEVKRQDRVNARISYIEGAMTQNEENAFLQLLQHKPEPLTDAEKHEWIQSLRGVSLSSDAFFPFRDNIDQCSKRGVEYIAQPGGSVQDSTVIEAANEYDMTMAFTGIRLFHH